MCAFHRVLETDVGLKLPRKSTRKVGLVLSGWFKGLDLVPSDIVAALFMMRAEQRDMEANAIKEMRRKEGELLLNEQSRANPSLRFV